MYIKFELIFVFFRQRLAEITAAGTKYHYFSSTVGPEQRIASYSRSLASKRLCLSGNQ